MPSAEEETQPKRESGSGQSLAPPQPPTTNAGPTLGNSPAMGYPGYPSSYPAYPNGPYNQQHAYAQAPPATYYGSPYPTHNNPSNRNSASGFFRGIFAGLIIIVVLICLSTIITWLVLQPKIPGFTVTRFTVSGFNVSGPVFSAQWTANLTIDNPNKKLKAYFNRIQSFVYYRDANGDDDFMAMGFTPPLYVEREKNVEMGTSLTAGAKDQPMVPSWVVDDMRKARGTGTVAFSLRIKVWANFRTEGWATRARAMKIFCEKLKVEFDRDTGNGAVSLPKPYECGVYV